MEACELNPVDNQVAAGHPDWSWPHVLGLDVAGIVDTAGEGVTGVRPGQRVAFHGDLRRPGGLAEYTLAEAAVLAPVPATPCAATAAALPCAGMTAHQAIVRRLHVTSADTVLVTGGADGAGGFAVQFAARAGARVITTATDVVAHRDADPGLADVDQIQLADAGHVRVVPWTGFEDGDVLVDGQVLRAELIA